MICPHPKIFSSRTSEHREHRGSIFKGVSKNGKKWQVLTVIRRKKHYMGLFEEEVLAARQYDKFALLAQGLKVSLRVFTVSRAAL